MQNYFNKLADDLIAKRTGEEVLMLNLSGEVSDFARFNTSRVRQAGTVSQHYLSLELIDGKTHASQTLTLTGDLADDLHSATGALAALRERLTELPPDPYLLYSTDVQNTSQVGDNQLLPAEDLIDGILAAGTGRDLVGIAAQGEIVRGHANSFGQRNWQASHSFNVEWCFYAHGDKAVKTHYADFAWSEEAFARKVDDAARQLELLSAEPRTIDPGEYRVYLAPAAVSELAGMMAWGGFGLKAHRTKTTCLLKMITDNATLSPAFTCRENTAEGLAPNFTSLGYLKPPAVPLITAGQYDQCLTSPRSAKEYGAAPNTGSEMPVSLEIDPGNIADDAILPTLEEGIYCNQLWYLNFSDRPGGRVTGMTRFATFWVEGGKLVAPMNVMRFDETLYRAFGENLLGLTARQDFLPDAGTYGGRSTASIRTPGAIINDFRFTL